MATSVGQIVFDPVQDSTEHIFFARNIQLTVGHQLFDFMVGQQKKLFGTDDLLEILQSVHVRFGVQLPTAVCVRKTSYTQTIGGVELSQQEFAAGFSHFDHLQDAAGW